MARIYKCEDCGAEVESGRLIWPITDVSEKVLPGEIMPAGECPECGALVPSGTAGADESLNDEEG